MIETQMRAWHQGDEALLARAGAELSPASLYSRFLAGVPSLPAAYLRMVATAPRWRWDGQVAMRAGRMIGWAEIARSSPECAQADLAVTVVDAWQRRGVGSALVAALLPRARAAGVTGLTAHVAASNVAARAALRRWFDGGATVVLEDGLLCYTLPL